VTSAHRDQPSSVGRCLDHLVSARQLATTGGMLIGISTPYRRIGLLHQKHRDYFGVDDPDVLVVVAHHSSLIPRSTSNAT
jgi:hypothetical protein